MGMGIGMDMGMGMDRGMGMGMGMGVGMGNGMDTRMSMPSQGGTDRERERAVTVEGHRESRPVDAAIANG